MKLNSSKILYLLLLLIPFSNIISNKKLTFVFLPIIFLLTSLLLFTKRKKSIKRKFLFIYIYLMQFILFLSYSYQNIVYSWNNFYFVYFFGFQVVFLMLLLININVNIFIEMYFYRLLMLLIIIISLSIIIDYFLLENGLIQSQLMYREGLYSYYTRPFGLFGQPSANSVILISLYLFYLSNKNLKYKFQLFLIITVAIFLQNSGSGYISYLFLFFGLLYKNKLGKFFIPLFIVFIVYFITLSDSISKINISYLMYNYEYFLDLIQIFLDTYYVNTFDILLGGNGNYNIPIDFGPIFMIAKVGIIYYVLYIFLILYTISSSKVFYTKISLITLLIGGLHYPIMFYPLMNILLPIIILKEIKSE